MEYILGRVQDRVQEKRYVSVKGINASDRGITVDLWHLLKRLRPSEIVLTTVLARSKRRRSRIESE